MLTWIEVPANPDEPTIGRILDDTYNSVATIHAGNGLNLDQHEFLLTPQNTALISIYRQTSADLSSLGGAASGIVIEGVVQEIDVATGRVLFEWHSLPDVPITDSYLAAPSSTDPNASYDYFHLNSISIDTDGNLLISARHTWTVYKINRSTGALMWRLGGKRSSFALGDGAPFAWQHNAIAVDASTIRIFDNEAAGGPVLPYSRVIWVRRDETAMTAKLVRSITHPDGLSAAFMGNAEELANGDVFVGWGSANHFSEFDANGHLLFDAAEADGHMNYRSYRFPWVGKPTDKPSAVAEVNRDGSMTVHAIWNGATEVASWTVLGGSMADALHPIGTVKWNGLDTTIPVPGQNLFVQVVASSATGATLGASATILVAPPNVVTSAAYSVAVGFTATLTTPMNNMAGVRYQWYHQNIPVDGATNPCLVLGAVKDNAAGTYMLTATSAVRSTIVSAIELTLSPPVTVSRLRNFSVLANANAECVAGFGVGGVGTSGSTTLLVRASGPALKRFGVSSVLTDPDLMVYRGSTAIAANDNWNLPAANGVLVTATAATAGAFSYPNPTSLDSALVSNLPAGSYTASFGGSGITAGLVLFELYDTTFANTPNVPRLTNLSVRGLLGKEAGNLVAGFVVQGSTAKTVLIRATGPALRAFGITNTLPDPQLTLHTTSGGNDTVLATNVGWRDDLLLSNAGHAAGAFALNDLASADSAVLMMLPPGAYTVDVSSASGSTGVALLEVYEVP